MNTETETAINVSSKPHKEYIGNIGSENQIIRTKHYLYICIDSWISAGKRVYHWLIYKMF
jgi:hypothetical protein